MRKARGCTYNLTAVDYPLHVWLTNSQRFAYTVGLPAMTNPVLESLSGSVLTDGGGHIAGSVYTRAYFSGRNNQVTNYATFILTVTGTTSDQGTNRPLVQIYLQGYGYDTDVASMSNYPNARLSLKFTSTNKLVVVPSTQVTVTNSNYSVTYADGSTQTFTNGPLTITNPAYTSLPGTMRGSIAPGTRSPLNKGSQLTIIVPAELNTVPTKWALVNGTNLVEQVLGGGLALDILTNIDAQVPPAGARLGSLSECRRGQQG